MRPELYVLKTEVYDWCALGRQYAAKHKNSRAAKAIIDWCEATEAHFGLEPGAKVTIIRDE